MPPGLARALVATAVPLVVTAEAPFVWQVGVARSARQVLPAALAGIAAGATVTVPTSREARPAEERVVALAVVCGVPSGLAGRPALRTSMPKSALQVIVREVQARRNGLA